MKCLLGFFHDAGCPCSGFFHPPPPQDVCIMNVGWVIISKNEFYWKRIVVWSQFITHNLVNPATIWGKRPKLTINIANLPLFFTNVRITRSRAFFLLISVRVFLESPMYVGMYRNGYIYNHEWLQFLRNCHEQFERQITIPGDL